MFLFHSSRANCLRNVGPIRFIVRQKSNVKKPILYGDEASPPVRFVLMTASILNIDVEFRKIDLFAGDNKTEVYTKINPLQKVPALSINDEVICDSHAIALHLCRMKKNNQLYPEDVLLRSKIDEMLYFNSGVLFPIDSLIFSDFFAGKWPADEVWLNKWYSALDYLEQKLSKYIFLTGDKLRLCDLSCASTVSSLEILVPLLDRHGNVKQWLNNMKSMSAFEINEFGLKRLAHFVLMMKK